jgi:hypothetical protein
MPRLHPLSRRERVGVRGQVRTTSAADRSATLFLLSKSEGLHETGSTPLDLLEDKE